MGRLLCYRIMLDALLISELGLKADMFGMDPCVSSCCFLWLLVSSRSSC